MRIFIIALFLAISYAQTDCTATLVATGFKCSSMTRISNIADANACANRPEVVEYFAYRSNKDRCEYPVSGGNAVNGLAECFGDERVTDSKYNLYQKVCPTDEPTKNPTMYPTLDPTLGVTATPVTAAPIDCNTANSQKCSCTSGFEAACPAECSGLPTVACYPPDVLKLIKIFDDTQGEEIFRSIRYIGAGKRIRSVVRDWKYSNWSKECRQIVRPKWRWRNMKEVAKQAFTRQNWVSLKRKLNELKAWYDANPDSLKCRDGVTDP